MQTELRNLKYVETCFRLFIFESKFNQFATEEHHLLVIFGTKIEKYSTEISDFAQLFSAITAITHIGYLLLNLKNRRSILG